MTKFLSWKDAYAWTEDMRHFRTAAVMENKLFEATVDTIRGGSKRQEGLKSRFAAAAAEHVADLLWTFADFIDYRPNLEGGGGYLWRFKGGRTKSWKEAGDIDMGVIGGQLATIYTVETGKGTQSYTLMARNPGRVLWKSSVEIGSDIAVLGEIVYALEVDTPLRYNRLISIDLATGERRRVLFRNTDNRWTLRLVRAATGGLFMIREQAGYQQCYHIRADGSLERMFVKGVCFYPLGLSAKGEPIVLVREGAFSNPWRIRVSSRESLDAGLKNFQTEDGIEFATAGPAGEIFVTRNFGERTLWTRRSPEENFHPARKFWGTVLVDPLVNWKGLGLPDLWISCPGSTLQCVSATGKTLVRGATYAKVKNGVAISKDGLPVRWLLAYSTAKPKGLVVVSYGGYGLPTPLATARWKPWLEAGWAIGFALVRGGGDGSEVWASIGRLSGKENGIDDLEAVIVSLQIETKVRETDTVIYGRSAGGLMVGGIAGRHPHGGLARKIYAEVPYVDLLKTASNPALPLTPSEYAEFGNPAAGPAEFEQTMRSSPVHRLPIDGAPGLLVVCRTGMFDLQVYPYESLKWILALRGTRAAPDDKYLHVAMEGHFTKGEQKYRDMAEDFLLLTN